MGASISTPATTTARTRSRPMMKSRCSAATARGSNASFGTACDVKAERTAGRCRCIPVCRSPRSDRFCIVVAP